MIKKILLLLIFSVSFLTSAQEINVADVAVPGRPTYKHVYLTEHEDLFQYASNAVVTVSTFTAENGLLTIGDDEYTMSRSLSAQALNRMDELGIYGLFFNVANGPSWTFPAGVAHRWYLPDTAVTTAAFLADPAWEQVTPQSWLRYDGCIRYEAVIPQYPGNEWSIDWWRGDRETYGGYLPAQTTSQGVVDAINAHRNTLNAECPTCINTDSSIADKYALLNNGRGFSDYVEGVTDWIPSGATNTIWTYQDANGNGLFNQITERDDTFILYMNIAGDAGGLPAPTGIYSCLDDLIAAL